MDNKNKYFIYKNKYRELKSHQYMIGGGDYSLIRRDLLQYVSSNETPRDRQIREKQNPHNGPYTVFDSIEELTDFYIRDDSDRKRQLLKLFNRFFGQIFIPENRMQLINTRGNGLCAYNSLYMYLQLTDKQEIIKIITNDGTDNFESFRLQLRDLTIKTLPIEIKDTMIPFIDDTNHPELQPIFNAFTQMTGINIILIDINITTFKHKIYKFEDKTPWDYIVLLRIPAHVMLIHSHTNEFRIRQQIYQQF